MKNTPITNERSYLLQLMEKIEAVIKLMRCGKLYSATNKINGAKTYLKITGLNPIIVIYK